MEKLCDLGVTVCGIYFSAICNLKCTYCFQPKHSTSMEEQNKRIVQWISTGEMESDLEHCFGAKLNRLSFWGMEPSLNLPILQPRLESLLRSQPLCNQIDYSTNLSTRKLTENTIGFIEELSRVVNSLDRKMTVRVQISIDGCPEINDEYRIGSHADEILENLIYALTWLKDAKLGKLKVCFHFKSTVGSRALHWLSDFNNLSTNYHYFDNFYKRCLDSGIPKQLIPRGAEVFTIVFPGDYTQQSGLDYLEILKTLDSKEFRQQNWQTDLVDFDSTASRDLREYLKISTRNSRRVRQDEFYFNSTCGAGRSYLGLAPGRIIHLCHNSFAFDDQLDAAIAKEESLKTNKDLGFNFSSHKAFANNKLVVPFDDELRLTRLLYEGHCFSRYLSFRENLLRITIDNLLAADQLSKDFLFDEELKNLFVRSLPFSCGSCISSNNSENGTQWVTSTSQLKLYGNGVFQYCLQKLAKEKKKYDT